jgi:hypothetical protein
MLNAGMDPDSNNPLAQSRRQTLLRFYRAYHLITAPVGEFNRDTTGFQGWLNGFVANRDTNGWTQGYIPYIHLQIWHALYNPESAIWSEIRWLDTGLDPVLPGEGPQVYWDYLIEPATVGFDPTSRDGLESRFSRLVLDYQTERALNPGNLLAFSTYLLETDFFDAWLTVE